LRTSLVNPANPGDSTPAGQRTRRALVVFAMVVLLASACVLCIPGSGLGAYAPLVLLERLVYSLVPAVAYLAAGVGFGRLLRPLWRGATDEFALQVGVGLGLMLTLSHLMGWAGLLSGQVGRWAGLGTILIGAALALQQTHRSLRGGGWEPRVSPLGLLSAIGIAVLLVAACAPPGIHWASEFGGYDVLEYHLQLPQEWLFGGRLRPFEHNVYSFLPSYMEAAYLHLGAATSGGRQSIGQLPVLVEGEGYRLIACQLLHAGFALVAAWLTARLSRRLAGAAAGPVAFGLAILTPWTVVTGSMAYNEMTMLAMLAAGLLAACETGLPAWRRGVMCGLLVGVAASVKPTGLLFVGVPVGVMLLALARVREWPAMIGAGCVVGLAVLGPWLARNAIACGNPVFPFAASLFPNELGGTGHWTGEQVARYMAAHRFDGSLLERVRLLVAPDPGAAAGAPNAHRGMMHGQWGFLFPFALLGAGLLLKRPRPVWRELLPFPLALLGAGLVLQVVLWLFTTHLQSRFLLPLLVPAAVLAAAGLTTITSHPRARLLISAVPLVIQLVFTVNTFLAERGGQPNVGLANGVGVRTGEFFDGLPSQEVAGVLERCPPELFVNLALKPGTRVYLLGDATPLYFTRPVIYQTTYDTSPLSGVEVSEWNRVFRSLGVDVVLVNLSEIARLEKSGWNPPGVTAARVTQWMQEHSMPLLPPQRWESSGMYLVAPADAAPGSGGGPRP